MSAHAMPLDRINVQAGRFNVLRALQWLIAALLLALGWSAHMVVRGLRTSIVVVGYCVGWVCVAVREGWREAAKSPTR